MLKPILQESKRDDGANFKSSQIIFPSPKCKLPQCMVYKSWYIYWKRKTFYNQIDFESEKRINAEAYSDMQKHAECKRNRRKVPPQVLDLVL
jgi:hypothetical protein